MWGRLCSFLFQEKNPTRWDSVFLYVVYLFFRFCFALDQDGTTMTVRDVTRFCGFLSTRKSGNSLRHFLKNPAEKCPPNCRFLSLVMVKRILTLHVMRTVEDGLVPVVTLFLSCDPPPTHPPPSTRLPGSQVRLVFHKRGKCLP